MLVDADHGYGNALNVRRTVQELEAAGAAGLTIEDTLLPQAFGQTKTQLISLEEGVGKMKAALDGRSDPSLVIIGAHRRGLDHLARRRHRAGARPMRPPASMRCSSPASRTAASWRRSRRRRRLPIVLGGAPEDMTALDYLASQRVRIALQGHAPFAAATQAVYETLKALREGTLAEEPERAGVVRTDRPRDARGRREGAQRRFLGLKKPMSDAIRHVTIRGRVQGVGYRAWVEHQARARGSRRLGAQPPRRQRRGGVRRARGRRGGDDRGMPARAVIGAGRGASGTKPAIPTC